MGAHHSDRFAVTYQTGKCPHCGHFHTVTCPRIKSMEYHPDGTLKKIEFHGEENMLEKYQAAQPSLGSTQIAQR